MEKPMKEVLKQEMLTRIATAIDPTKISMIHASRLHNPHPKRPRASSNLARAMREHFHLNSCYRFKRITD